MEYHLAIVNLAQRTSLGAVRAGCFAASPCLTLARRLCFSLPRSLLSLGFASSFFVLGCSVCVGSVRSPWVKLNKPITGAYSKVYPRDCDTDDARYVKVQCTPFLFSDSSFRSSRVRVISLGV